MPPGPLVLRRGRGEDRIEALKVILNAGTISLAAKP